MKKIFYWLPRVLSILFIIFISLFALDVFEEPQWFLALIIHLIPSYILIAITIVAWKNEKAGGILFLLAGIALMFLARSGALIVAAPPLVIGILFLGRKYFSGGKLDYK